MNDRWRIDYFGEPEQLARSAAGLTVELLDAVPPGKTPLLALSGGRIANDYFRALLRVWEDGRTHFFWADERCVPPDSDQSNFLAANSTLLKPAGIEDHRVHRIRGELPPEQAAREAEVSLRKVAGAEHPALPRLDLVILGMGEDGHIASLFPGGLQPSPGASECFRAVIGPKPPPQRVTMTWELLVGADQVVVMISGEGKEHALANALSLKDMNPLSTLLRLRAQTTLLSTVRPKEFPRSFCPPRP